MFEANILAYAAAAALIMLTPGPSNILVMTRSASSVRAGLATLAGLLVANMILLAAAIFGISSLVVAYQPALTALKWIGAAYLVYLGVKLIKGARAPIAATPPAARHGWDGFLTAITNPKALIFYFAFLPQFVSDDANVQLQLVGLGIIDITLAALVFGAFALAGPALARVFRHEPVRIWLNRGTGFAMIGAAALVLDTQSPARA